MTWQPGTQVITEQDHAEWRAFRRQRIVELQRLRRARCRRVDYYLSDKALAIIQSQTNGFAGGDYSSVINRLVAESTKTRGSG